MQIQQRCHDCQELLLVPEPRYREMVRAGGRVICPACGAYVKPHDPVPRWDGQERAHPVKLFSIPEYVPPPRSQAQKKNNHGKKSKSGAPRKKPKPRKKAPPRIINIAPSPVSYSKYQDRPREYKKARTVEALRRDIAEKGRVFVLGCAPSLTSYDLSQLTNWPTIGTNSSFNAYQYLDVLVMCDYGFICRDIENIQDWQKRFRGRFLFWMRQTKHQGTKCEWQRAGRLHGRCMDIAAGQVIFDKQVPLEHSNVQYFEATQGDELIHELQIPIRLNFQYSTIFPAINLAYVLGAREIILLGVEAENNTHFDERGDADQEYPRGDLIIEKIERWQKKVSVHGCEIKTCLGYGELARKIPNVQFDRISRQSMPYFLERLHRKIQNKGRVFLMGAGPHLNELPLQLLMGWPVICVNTSFLRYWYADALIFGDDGFIRTTGAEVQKWQQERENKPILFWHKCSPKEGFTRVVPWQHAPGGPMWENLPGNELRLAICRSIITPAINLAYSMGAREIYLLGVQLDNCCHFWDEDGERAQEYGVNAEKFPGGREISEFIVTQSVYLQAKGVQLATCYPEGILKDRVPFVSLENATDPRALNPVDASFGGRKKINGGK